MAGTGIQSIALLRGQIPLLAGNNLMANRSQVHIGLPSSALRWQRIQHMRPGQACGNPLSNLASLASE
jgi:hypothetical protein